MRDVVDAMTAEAGLSMPLLQVDGGASANDLLCRLQADTWQLDRRFEPTAGVRDDGTHARWLRAVERASDWS